MTVQFIQDVDVVEEDDSLTSKSFFSFTVHHHFIFILYFKYSRRIINFHNSRFSQTRSLLVALVCNITRDIGQFCVFDDVKLFILERKFLLVGDK